MATEFKLELDIKDLTKSIDVLGSIGSQLDSVVRKIKDAQDKVAAKNIGGLTKLVNAVKRKQKELADAFVGTKIGQAMKRWQDNLKTASRLIQKGIVQPLGKALSVARNMGLALMGAATAAIYFSRGTIQATTESKDAGFRSLNEKKALEFANKTTGRNLDPSTFNESVLSNTKAWDAFGRLGISKTKYIDLVKDKGGAAGLAEFVKEITDAVQSGKWDTLTGGIQDHIIEALSEVMGGMSQGMALSFFKNKGEGSSTDWSSKFAEGKEIWKGASFKGMYQTEVATERLMAQFDKLKNTLVELFTPHLSNAINGVAEGFKRLHKWLGSEEGKAAMERFKEGLTKLSAVIKDVLLGAFVGIAKMLNKTGLIDLDKGTLEWLDSIVPQKSFADKQKEAMKNRSIYSYIPGTADYEHYHSSVKEMWSNRETELQKRASKLDLSKLSIDDRHNITNLLHNKSNIQSEGLYKFFDVLIRQLEQQQGLIKVEIVDKTSEGIKVTKQIAAGGR